jgi:hypothetical protein
MTRAVAGASAESRMQWLGHALELARASGALEKAHAQRQRQREQDWSIDEG